MRINKQNISTESEIINSDTPSVPSKPIVSELVCELTELVDWQIFAANVPNVTHGDIKQINLNNPQNIDHQKLELYGTWLRRFPNAS